MDKNYPILINLQLYGVGRRKLNDNIFRCDKPPSRLGICDVDDENLCHNSVKLPCTVPGCKFEAESLLEFENHYNASHRYSCSQCKKVLTSPHFLDLHIEERHDSFFAVMAEKKASYSCYIEECKEKFINPEARLEHCVKVHKIPKNFRFEEKPMKPKEKNKSQNNQLPMEVDSAGINSNKKINLHNNKQKSFTRYTGRKFTSNEKEKIKNINMDEIMQDLKENLPN